MDDWMNEMNEDQQVEYGQEDKVDQIFTDEAV